MYNVFITRRIPESGINILKQHKNFRVRVSAFDNVLSRKQLLKQIKGCHAVLSMLTDRIDKQFFNAAGRQLKIVANFAVGFDNVDIKEAKRRGVIITNTPGVLTTSVAEHTVALIFAIAKRIAEADRFTRAGKYKGWGPMLLLGTELEGKTVGIVGLGRIGFSVAEKLVRGMGLKVVYNDPHRNTEFEKKYGAQFMKLPALLKACDVVTLHVPLVPATYHLISTKQLRLMKRTAYLINTSRGPVVDEKALERALASRRIAGAALDVFECEPAIDCDVRDDLELKKLDNVVLTPHTASATLEARSKMAELAAKNITAVLSGRKPLTPV
jgi:glyoxylate reductase